MRYGRLALIAGFLAGITALVIHPTVSAAGERSLIAGFHTGDEVRYTFTARGNETTSLTGQTGAGAHSLSTEKVGVLIRCKAETVPLIILEVVYETFSISLDSPQGNVEVDLGGPAPGPDAPQLSQDLYRHLHGIAGTTLTINIAPGSGEITRFQGGEALLKTQGASVLRRYLDRDLFSSTFGPIFELKPNSVSPPPGEKWYVQRHIFAYAHPGKSPVWETRLVDNVLADIATIKGSTRASGDPAGAEKAPAFFKTVNGESTFVWDLVRGRLISGTRTDVVNSRFVQDKANKDSDLIVKSELEIVKPGDPKPVPASAAPGGVGEPEGKRDTTPAGANSEPPAKARP